MPTHKKGHDKDKYYFLAKDQGYRSRAAFKLIQINKRFDFLTKARVTVDLCAAPGGWCQVAQKCMPAGSIVLGVDLLPIKAIRNVKTIVSDITTAECRKLVSSELQGWKADVVLCDGAPNIGAAYSKDAYVQNELVLAALKTATDHLVQGGTFCTKVYRSTDYNALIWVFQQLFEEVQAMKPNSSRSQSSEIFIICLKFTAPKHIDPKLLDPNHIFKEVSDPGLKTVDVLHKKYDKLNKRHRTGYDESLGMTLRSTVTATDFVMSRDPIRVLTDANEIVFSDGCAQYKNHVLTTKEFITCFSDLRVLGKIDFKKILKWRAAMRTEFHAAKEPSAEDAVKEEAEDASVDEEEEIMKIQTSIAKTEKKEVKKARQKASKERQRQALGMSGNAFSDSHDMELFSLPKSNVSGLEEVDLDDEDLIPMNDMEEDESMDVGTSMIVGNEDLEDQLEHDYLRFMSRRKAASEKGASEAQLMLNDGKMEGTQEGRTRSAKRSRLARTSDAIVANRMEEEANGASVEGDIKAYVKLLTDPSGEDGSEDDSSGSDDEDEASADKGAEEGGQSKRVVSRSQRPDIGGAGRWFSHPIFSHRMQDEDETPTATRSGRNKSVSDEVLSQMPKTDKEVRKEKRKKQKDRTERRESRRGALLQDDSAFGGFEVAPAEVTKEEDFLEGGDSADEKEPDPEVRRRRELIRQGMGSAALVASRKAGGVGDSSEIEIVPQSAEDSMLPTVDDRSYDSDHEEYDAHDRAVTMALGTLMLRKSRQKALVDASYNRFTWNDPKDLPTWFLDDEVRHNKPQLPVPTALLDQIKGRHQLTGTKEIKKVAEARMRKRKRAASKLKSAKRQATAMAENSELSERQKLKAIARAMKTSKVDKPGKVYVVTKKTGAGSSGTMASGAKGKLKFVDKRMKKDTRAMKAKAKGKKRH